MGRDFRDSSYFRRTWLSKRTVKDGEACVKWSLGGKATEVIGPMRCRTFFTTIRFLDRIKAGPFEFLRVEHRSGNVEHLRGPRAIWVNPVLHAHVEVRPSYHLASPAEALVVYRAAVGEPAHRADGKRDGAAVVDRLARLVVRGPTVFAPEFGERVHTFKWSTPTATRTFETLPLAAATMKLRAPVTSRDGGRGEIAINLGYKIQVPDSMLDGCDDLPAELTAALAADLIDFGRGVDALSLRNVGALSDALAPRSPASDRAGAFCAF